MVSMEINVAYGIFRDSDVLPTYECDLILICLIVYVYFMNLSAETISMGKKKKLQWTSYSLDQNCKPYKCQSGLPLSQVYDHAVNVKKLLDYIGKLWQLISSL